MNLRIGIEILLGVLNGALLYACFELMSEYALFVLIALMHIQASPYISKAKYLHLGALTAYAITFLTLMPHNFYFVPFVALIYFMAWAVSLIPKLQYKAMACVLFAALIMSSLNWVLIATVHTNRILDGTYFNYFLTKKSVQSDNSSN